jgi:hypothetical protein
MGTRARVAHSAAAGQEEHGIGQPLRDRLLEERPAPQFGRQAVLYLRDDRACSDARDLPFLVVFPEVNPAA